MRKLVLLCTVLAALCCLAFAEYQVNAPGYEAAKERYYQLMDKIVDRTATNAEAAEFSDLCQVYGFDVPVAELPESAREDRGSLDQGGTDCGNPTVIEECPFEDTGQFDGDNDCSPSSASPYNDVFYQFTPNFSGRIQMRARSYTTGVAAIRVVTGNCCTGTSVAFSSSSVASNCYNPYGGMEPTTVVTYLYYEVTEGVTYWIHVGTSSSTSFTANYEFNLWCWQCPSMEPEQVHNSCATAWEIACGDSIFGDSAFTTAPSTPDWYKVVVADYTPMACSLYVFVGARELGHCISGKYPSSTTAPLGAVDGRFTLYRERPGEPCVLDSIGYNGDDGCSYDARKTFAVDPGTYYVKVWNHNVNDYVMLTRCIEYNPEAACCFLDASCQDMGASACAAAGGWSKPIGVLCATEPCPTSPCPHDNKDIEPNNACQESQEVACDGWYCGVVSRPLDEDWYKLVIADCESLVVDIFADDTPSQWPFGQGLNPYVYLYKSDCVTSLAYNDNNNGTDPDPVGQDSRLKKVVGPGTYYIRVKGTGNTSGPYVMHITCFRRDCLPGDFCGNAIGIGSLPYEDVDKTTCGYIDDYRLTCMGSYSNGPDVIYTIELDGNTCIACSLFATGPTGGSSYGSVSLYANCPTSASEPCIAKSATGSTGPYGFTCQGIEGALPAGTYYIMVDNYAPGPDCINYTLRVFACDCPNPCPYPNRDTETDDQCGDDPSIVCGELLCGFISATADTDWYQFELAECCSVWVNVYANDTPGQWPYGQGLDPYAYLYRSDCASLVASNDDIGGSPYNDDSWIRTMVLFPGTYHIGIKSTTSSIGPYVLELTCFPVQCPDTTGDNCEDARAIAGLPYYDRWTTCTYYSDDYNVTCLGNYDNGPDVLYRLEVTERTCVTCSLTSVTPTYRYPGLAIFDGCPDVGICMTYKTSSSGPLGTTCQVLLPGHVYYIMVDNNPSPPCVDNYLLEVEPCECPLPCDEYVLCGSPGEVEPNNTCPPPEEQAEITCDMSVYGLHCPFTDTDFWKVTIPPMAIMTIRLYTGSNCDETPPVGVRARYYNDLCASPSTGTTSPIVISNTTEDPLVKYLEVYDSGIELQTVYKVEATCCYVRNYCEEPIVTGAGTYVGGFWTYDSTVNTCCATRAVDTIWSRGCEVGTKFASGPSVVFRFTLETTNVLDIVATSPLSQDIQMYVFTDCANPRGTCIASEDDGGTAEDTLGIVLPAGTYYVAVMRYGAANCADVRLQIKSDCPLPVNLLGDVVATAGSEKVTLSWATASEISNDHFEIVRNGRMIGRVAGAGTSPSRHDYSWSEEGLNNGQTYSYTLRSVDINGRVTELATVSATPSFAAGEVTEYALHQNYPNPFNPTTTIAFDLLEAGNVSLKIYNLMGQEVRTVVSGAMPKGRHVAMFDSGDLSSGIYLYRIEVNGFVAEKKMLLMK